MISKYGQRRCLACWWERKLDFIEAFNRSKANGVTTASVDQLLEWSEKAHRAAKIAESAQGAAAQFEPDLLHPGASAPSPGITRIQLIVGQTSVVNTLTVKEVAQVVLRDQIVPETNLFPIYAKWNLSVGHVVRITDLMFDLRGK
jgi:hypothetical protein